jgi:tripartite-type tricarboxylate transporter receptor subunit TctC
MTTCVAAAGSPVPAGAPPVMKAIKAWSSVLAVLALTAVPVTAQEYPAKPMRVAVGFAAGGPADAMARIIGKKITDLTGQSVVVDNRPGNNGFIAGEFVARAAPDGYTSWFAGGSSLSFVKQMYSKPLIDPDRDHALVTQAVSVPQVFTVHPALPAKTMRELAQLAARRPDQVRISVISLGGIVHLGVELFKREAGIRMINVQYKGGGPAAIDLMGGHIEAGLFDVPAVINYLPGGKLRALAVTSGARVKQIPDVPTTAEAGYPTVRSDSWYAVAVPAATPPDVIRRMNKLWASALRAADTQEQLTTLGAAPVGGTVEDVLAFRASEAKRWGELIRKINFKLE